MPKRAVQLAAVLRKVMVGVMLAASGLSSPVAASEHHEAEPGGQSKTLSRVFSAWRARQKRVRSFHFTWDLRIVLPKGAYAFPRGRRGLAGLRTWNVEFDGAGHLEFTFPQSEWWGEGTDRSRSDFGQFEYSEASGWNEKARYRLTHAGSLNSRLHVPASPSEPPQIAIWRQVPVKNPSNRSSSGDFLLKDREIDLGPLRLALRPFGPTAEWSPENCRVINENATLGNVRCIMIQMDKLDHSEMWWVDPSRDYSIVHWERRQPNSPPLDVAFEIKQASDHEWVPSRWSWQLPQQEAGRPATCEATVTRYTINEELPAGTFARSGRPERACSTRRSTCQFMRVTIKAACNRRIRRVPRLTQSPTPGCEDNRKSNPSSSTGSETAFPGTVIPLRRRSTCCASMARSLPRNTTLLAGWRRLLGHLPNNLLDLSHNFRRSTDRRRLSTASSIAGFRSATDRKTQGC